MHWKISFERWASNQVMVFKCV
jgi:hypothetical protein